MVLLSKQKAMYVKCCIIANGVQDSQGDTVYAEDIKRIFTSFNNQDNFEIYHDELPLQEVSLLENYISNTDESIGTAVVPAGSWNAVIRVDNPEIKQGLLAGEFQGVSLNNRIAKPCQKNLKGTIPYRAIKDKECIIPVFISFVERGANGYGLHVMDYDAYIRKSEDVELNYENENEGGNKMAFNLLEGLKDLVRQAEDSPEEEPVVEKAEETEEEEPVVEKEDNTEDEEEELVVEKADDTTDEEPEVEKSEDVVVEEETTEDDDRIASLEKKVDVLTELVNKVVGEKEADVPEDEVDEEEETEDEDTPKITKSEKVIIENNQPQQSNYFEMTGRDPITGKKIRH